MSIFNMRRRARRFYAQVAGGAPRDITSLFRRMVVGWWIAAFLLNFGAVPVMMAYAMWHLAKEVFTGRRPR